MDKHEQLEQYISANSASVNPIVDYHPGTDRFYHLNLTGDNPELVDFDIADSGAFDQWINRKLQQHNCRYGIGGYMEHRAIYHRSALFDTNDEPRRLHLGTDIWAPADTHIYAPLAGTIHSFKDNDHFGDYGPTIILEHNLNGLALYSLYGHLSRSSLNGLHTGHRVQAGQKIATLGYANENGDWPPHLHFQLMFDIQDYQGDYPGVGKLSERATLKANIPDPQLILQIPATTIVY